MAFLFPDPHPFGPFPFRTMIVTMSAITISGVVLMFRGHFPEGVQGFSRFVHAASFVIIAVFLIVHLYLSLLPMNRQSLHAMFGDGNLPVEYVKSQHPLWYEKLTRQTRPDPTPAENEVPTVTAEKLSTS